MQINHNIAALNTYRQLNMNQTSGGKSLEKLSSGLRINKAGDDAAGLAISEKMRAQIQGLNQGQRNAQDGISMIQTAEGNLSETQNILQRMRELANQAANDTNVNVDRSEIQKEINQLTSEINRIGNTTEFNTQKLLKGKNVAVVATAQDVTTATAGIAGVPVGDTSDLAVNAKSVIAIASHASVQGNTAAATGTVGLTDQTTVSVEGKDAYTIVSGLTFTSTTPRSATTNGITININQLANATGTANSITTSGSGSSTIINFNIGTGADGKSLFTGTNRGELANYLTGIAGYATSGVIITVPEDPSANGPASAEKLVGMPDNTQVATASTIYSGTLGEGVTEVRGVSTFSITNPIKEAGDTITVGGKTFTAVTTGANAAKGEFNISQTNAWLKAGVVVGATQDLSGVTNSSIAITVGGTAYTLSSAALAAYGNGAISNKTSDDVVSLLKSAVNGSVKLSDIADVSLGSDNKIQIIAKTGGDLTGANDISIAVTNGADTKGATISALLGLSTETSTANGANGAATGATVADQARSLRVAINADTTVGGHYTASGTLNTAEILMTENATKATGVSLASVTIAGGGTNNKLNITDLAGKNLSQVTIVKGTGVAVAGSQAYTSLLDTSLKVTSGTKSTEFGGVKINFAGLTKGATGTTASVLTTSWDAANQTLTVTGTVGDAQSAASFKDNLQVVLRTGLSAAGFSGAAGLTVAAGATAATAGNNEIALALNGKGLTFGAGTVTTVTPLDTTFAVTSAVAGTEFEGVKIAFSGLATSAGATALTSNWDAATKTLTVGGNFINTLDATTFAAAVQTKVRADLITAGFSTAGSNALTFAAGATAVPADIVTAFNGKSLTLTNGGGATAIAAHAMVVDQKNGNLTITLSDTTPNNNTAAKIQTAVQALGLVKASAGDVDFTKYQFTSEGNWDSKEVGENITKPSTTLVGGTKEVKGDYSFDITEAFDVGDKVVIKGQTFTAVASGAIGSKNEFDVAGGNANNQAISLRNAIGLNSTLSSIYKVGGTGTTVKMTEIIATGVDMRTTDLDVKATGTAGEYSVNVGLLENGAAFVLDGQEIKVSNKNAHVGYDNGTVIKVTESLAAQTSALADAINMNADLKGKYTASVGLDGSLVIQQNEFQESSTAPVVATKNSSIGKFSASLQIGANSGQSMELDVNDMRAAAISVSGDGSVGTVAAKDGKVASYVSVASVTDGTNNTNAEYSLDVSTFDSATAAISVINDAIELVSAERSKLGAYQNRLEHTIKNLGTSSENMTAAESRIRDVDMAKEMMEFTKNNILAQAGVAMLERLAA